jgi:hypothetical protein
MMGVGRRSKRRSRRRHRSPLSLPIAIVALALLFASAGSLVTYEYQRHPGGRQTITFAKDIFVAFITVSSLIVAAENLRRSAVAARKSLALALSERFERELATGQFASIIGRRDDSEMLEKVIAGDGQLEREVTNLCRLIETIAQSVCSGDADENVIVSRVGLEISFIVATLRPWVEEKRRKAGNPHLFETAEWLVDSMVDV